MWLKREINLRNMQYTVYIMILYYGFFYNRRKCVILTQILHCFVEYVPFFSE